MSELEEGEMVEEGEIAVEQQPDVDKKEKLKRSAPEIPVPSPKRKKSRKDPVPQDKEDVFKRPNFLEKPWQESKSNVALDFNTWMSFKTPIRLISQVIFKFESVESFSSFFFIRITKLQSLKRYYHLQQLSRILYERGTTKSCVISWLIP